jgi:hypothetical protein
MHNQNGAMTNAPIMIPNYSQNVLFKLSFIDNYNFNSAYFIQRNS